MIALVSSSIITYEPYMAVWPMLSDLPLPPNTRGRSSVCSHTRWMAGISSCLWWRKYVKHSTRNTLVGSAPAERMAADNWMLPAGAPLLTDGWLHHILSAPQIRQVQYTLKSVPQTVLRIVSSVQCWPPHHTAHTA